jgi:hypothetical protein
MIKEFVDLWDKRKEDVRKMFEQGHPEDYKEVVKNVVSILQTDEYGSIDPDRIHQIDDGDYQGTLLFVIADDSYQPSNYWYVKVSYGSCSGCDTLEGIRRYDWNEKPSKDQVEDYMTLALHIVQELKKME